MKVQKQDITVLKSIKKQDKTVLKSIDRQIEQSDQSDQSDIGMIKATADLTV